MNAINDYPSKNSKKLQELVCRTFLLNVGRTYDMQPAQLVRRHHTYMSKPCSDWLDFLCHVLKNFWVPFSKIEWQKGMNDTISGDNLEIPAKAFIL